jgi:hypothetical protein
MSSSNFWAEYLVRAKDRPIPELTLKKTRLHVLDTLAAVVSGYQLPAGQAGMRLAKRLGGAPEATVLSTPLFKWDAIQAATANAMLEKTAETRSRFICRPDHFAWDDERRRSCARVESWREEESSREKTRMLNWRSRHSNDSLEPGSWSRS